MRTRGPVVGGALLAVVLLLLRDSALDVEDWSRHDPFWRNAGYGVLLLYGFALALVTLRLAPASARRSLVLPLLFASPAILLKPEATDLAAWSRPLWWLVALPLALLLTHLSLAGLGAARRPGLLLLPLVGLLLWGGLRYGERCAMEEVVASGEVEVLLRGLAARLGDVTAAVGLPSGDLNEWLKNEVRPADWYQSGELWYWAPAPGLAPTSLRLRAHPPDGGSLWSVALVTEPFEPVCPRSRRYTAEITWDGGISWSWPDGPPAAVAARRADLGRSD